MSSLASPSTRAKAALLHPTSSPQQVFRRLEIEHSKVPFTPRTEEAVSAARDWFGDFGTITSEPTAYTT